MLNTLLWWNAAWQESEAFEFNCIEYNTSIWCLFFSLLQVSKFQESTEQLSRSLVDNVCDAIDQGSPILFMEIQDSLRIFLLKHTY